MEILNHLRLVETVQIIVLLYGKTNENFLKIVHIQSLRKCLNELVETEGKKSRQEIDDLKEKCSRVLLLGHYG